MTHPTLKLILSSDGVKKSAERGLPRADLLIDCRILREHFKFMEGGAAFTGMASGTNPSFRAALESANALQLGLIKEYVRAGIDAIPSRRGELADPYSKPFSICFFCAWGIHRSVSAKYILADWLKGKGYQVEVV